jgi:hypothetical protein
MLNLNPRVLFQLGNSTEGFHLGPDQLSRCAEDSRSRAQTCLAPALLRAILSHIWAGQFDWFLKKVRPNLRIFCRQESNGPCSHIVGAKHSARNLLNKPKIFYRMLRPHDRGQTKDLIEQCPDRSPHVIRLQRINRRRWFIATMDHAILALGIAALFAVLAPVG